MFQETSNNKADVNDEDAVLNQISPLDDLGMDSSNNKADKNKDDANDEDAVLNQISPLDDSGMEIDMSISVVDTSTEEDPNDECKFYYSFKPCRLGVAHTFFSFLFYCQLCLLDN